MDRFINRITNTTCTHPVDINSPLNTTSGVGATLPLGVHQPARGLATPPGGYHKNRLILISLRYLDTRPKKIYAHAKSPFFPFPLARIFIPYMLFYMCITKATTLQKY